MSISTKKLSDSDSSQTLQYSYNDNDKTLSTSGFIDGKIGHKFTLENVTATQDLYRFYDVYTTESATTGSGSPLVTLDTTVLKVGDYLFSANIPNDARILSINSITQVTLSKNATGTGTIATKVASIIKAIQVDYDNSTHDNIVGAERVQ